MKKGLSLLTLLVVSFSLNAARSSQSRAGGTPPGRGISTRKFAVTVKNGLRRAVKVRLASREVAGKNCRATNMFVPGKRQGKASVSAACCLRVIRVIDPRGNKLLASMPFRGNCSRPGANFKVAKKGGRIVIKRVQN